VVKFLIDRGIERERLKAQGFGPTRPVADNATPEGREATPPEGPKKVQP
jgi:outer membrane protein OmpA-like peptidoglycan-associated protein